MTGYPGDAIFKFGEKIELRPPQCNGGCQYELAIQLTVTMIGKAMLDNLIEIIGPALGKLYQRYTGVRPSFKKSQDQAYSKFYLYGMLCTILIVRSGSETRKV